jgi:hypothetical protein
LNSKVRVFGVKANIGKPSNDGCSDECGENVKKVESGEEPKE